MDTHSSPHSPLVAESTTPKRDRNTDVDMLSLDRKVDLPDSFSWTRPLYRPHGKWAWTEGKDILSADPGTRLGSGLEGTVNLKVGYIDDKEIVYVSKLTSVWDSWKLLLPQLYLNASSKYLRPLQGDCIPWMIGVLHCDGGRLGVAQDLPHPTGWREADMFLEDYQKENIIAAYQKLHDRGILHGDVNYRHMLIGDDGKVTIIDFGFSCVLYLDEHAKKARVGACSPWDIQDEMRKVKFMLDWKDSRATEYKLAKLRHDREERDSAARWTAIKKLPVFSIPNISPEPMSDEEKAAPPSGALKISDLNEWSHGEQWTARRYEIIRHDDWAEIRKSNVSRPPISEKVKAEPPLITAAPTSKATEAPAEAIPRVDDKEPQSTPPPEHEKAVPKPDANPPHPTTGKRSRESEVSNSESTIEDEPAKKRRRSAQLPAIGQKLSSEKPEHSEPASILLERMHTVFPASKCSMASRTLSAHKQSPVLTGVPGNWAPPVLASDPTAYELDPESRASLSAETLRSWGQLSEASAHIKQLQTQLDAEKLKVERIRSDSIRRFLMLRPEQRTAVWAEMGRPDVRRLLGLLPDSPAAREPAVTLEAARTNLTKSTKGSGRPPPRLKVHPRLAAIKRCEARSRSPSKLSQVVDVASCGGPDLVQPASGVSRSDEPDNGPSPELKAKLEQLERYQQVVMWRAQLEEEKERASSKSPPPPAYTTRPPGRPCRDSDRSSSQGRRASSIFVDPRATPTCTSLGPTPGPSKIPEASHVLAQISARNMSRR